MGLARLALWPGHARPGITASGPPALATGQGLARPLSGGRRCLGAAAAHSRVATTGTSRWSMGQQAMQGKRKQPMTQLSGPQYFSLW